METFLALFLSAEADVIAIKLHHQIGLPLCDLHMYMSMHFSS